MEALIAPDIVVTTYATLAADHDSRGVLYRMEWYRVVLDEGEFHGLSTLIHLRLAPHQLIISGILPRSSGNRPRIFEQHGDGVYQERRFRTRWKILPRLRDFSNCLH